MTHHTTAAGLPLSNAGHGGGYHIPHQAYSTTQWAIPEETQVSTGYAEGAQQDSILITGY